MLYTLLESLKYMAANLFLSTSFLHNLTLLGMSYITLLAEIADTKVVMLKNYAHTRVNKYRDGVIE